MGWLAFKTTQRYMDSVRRERESAAVSDGFLDNLREERMRTPEGREQERLRDLEEPDKILQNVALTSAGVAVVAAAVGAAGITALTHGEAKHPDHSPHPETRQEAGSEEMDWRKPLEKEPVEKIEANDAVMNKITRASNNLDSIALEMGTQQGRG